MSNAKIDRAFCRGCDTSFETVEELLDHDCDESGTGPGNEHDDGPDGRPPLVADGGQSEMGALDRDSKIVTAVYTTDAPAENFSEMWAQSHYPSADRVEVYDRFEGRDVLVQGDRPVTRICPACGQDAVASHRVDGEQLFRHHEDTDCKLEVSDRETKRTSVSQSSRSKNRLKRVFPITLSVALAGVVGYAVTPVTSKAVAEMGAGSPDVTPLTTAIFMMVMVGVIGAFVFLTPEVLSS